MLEKQPQRRIHVPPGHQLRRTGTESVQRNGVDTRISYFEVVDPKGERVGSYAVREVQSTNPSFEASVTVEVIE